MKPLIVSALLFVSLAFSLPKQNISFGQLHNLTGGTWTMKTNRGWICEQWEKKNDQLISGRSFKINGTDTVVMENLRLTITSNQVVYNSQVNGQNDEKSVAFALTEAKDGQFIFSNPQHDFPQRIIYHFINKDSLHAWIDGKINGKEKKSDFYYTRK